MLMYIYFGTHNILSRYLDCILCILVLCKHCLIDAKVKTFQYCSLLLELVKMDPINSVAYGRMAILEMSAL